MENQSKLKTKNYKKTAVKIAVEFVRYFFLISLSYVVLYQLAYILSQSFKPLDQANDPSIVWLPKSFTFENIQLAWKELEYLKSFWNTLFIQVGSGLLQVFTCSLVAYGNARFKFKGKNLIFFLVILTIVVPPQMIIVPTYLNYAHLDFLGVFGFLNNISGIDLRPNIIDTALTFYLPSIFGVGLRSGLFIFIYRQFFKKMPQELEEAAWIDGAGPFKTFLTIIIPSSGVAMLTVTIFSVIWHYNDYYLSAMYLSNKNTLAVSLSMLENSARQINLDYAQILNMAGCLLFIIPVLLMYMILQKRFIQNIDRVGIVG